MKVLSVLALALAAFTAVIAQTPTPNSKSTNKQAPQKQHLIGCPITGVEGCLILSTANGKSYQINAAPAKSDPPGTPAAKPDPSRRLQITVDAEIDSGAVDTCLQGPILKNIDWRYSKQSCPLNAPSKDAKSQTKK